MKGPEMILFDYGLTLLYEPGFDMLRGEKALLQHVKTNKSNLTRKQVNEFSQMFFEKIGSAWALGLELREQQFQKFLYECLKIELAIPLPEDICTGGDK